MDGCSCVGSVVVTRPERLHNLASTSLSLSLFSIFFLSFREGSLLHSSTIMNMHVKTHACTISVGVCVSVCRADSEGTSDETSLIFHPSEGIDLKAIRQ